MILYICMGILAAVGALFFLWVVLGCFLPVTRRGTAVISCRDRDLYAVLRRYRWLRELGLTRFELVILDSQLSPETQQNIQETYPGIRFMTKEQWLKE